MDAMLSGGVAMPGLKGNTIGVGHDIIDYLSAVANHFKLTIVITSGYRSADDQASAMYKNWLKLKCGTVYSKKALPEADREQPDAFYKAAMEDPKADSLAKTKGKSGFLALARARLGMRSQHTKGRAVDVTQASVSPAAYRAIILHMKEVKEGNRRDIHHFESATLLQKPSAADMTAWNALSTAPVPHVHVDTTMIAGLDLPCLEARA